MESTPQQDMDGGLQRGIKIRDVLEHQPFWDEYRDTARRCFDVFDGQVVSDDFLEYAEDIGMPTMKVNLVKKTILSVAGHSEKLQTDVMVRASDKNSQDMAEAMNYKLNTNWRIAKVNRAIQRAHLDQLVGGIGWVNVRRNRRNRLAHKYIVEYVPWQEMKWDTYSARGGFDKCRWVAREQRFNADVLKVNMPKHIKLIEMIENGYNDGEFDSIDDDSYYDHNQLYDEERRLLTVREVYERVPEMRWLVQQEDGIIVEDGPEAQGERFEGPVDVIKKSIFVGHSKVWYSDYESMRPGFIPLPAYTKDQTNVPVGPVYDMIDPMYVYNKVLNEQLHILSTNKIFVKPDMLHEDYDLDDDGVTLDMVRQETLRRDGALFFNKNADLNKDVVIMREWENLSNLQTMKIDARDELRDVSGINYAMSGEQGQHMSGKAAEYAIDLGSTNMAVLLANKREAEHGIAEVLQELEMNDVGNRFEEIEVKSQTNGRARTIRLNSVGEDGQISNRLSQSKIYLAMESVESSAGYRAHVQEQLQIAMGQLANSPYLDSFAKLWIKNSGIPGAEAELEKINMQAGVPDTPEELAEQLQAQAQSEQEAKQLEMEGIQAEIEHKRAQAQQALAVAETSRASARKTLAEAESEDETPTVDLEKIRLKIEAAKLRLEEKKLEAESQKIAAEERAAKLDKVNQWATGMAA